MKRIFFIFSLLLAGMGIARATNTVTVETVHVPQNTTGTINVVLNNDQEFTGFNFDVQYPEGISYVSYEAGNRFSDHSFTVNESGTRFACLSLSSAPISGNDGTVLSINVKLDNVVAVGTTFQGKLLGIVFNTPDGEGIDFEDIDINFVVDEPADLRVVLDENNTAHPQDANDVDVRVKRTLKANVWNTLVLPFDMSSEQLTAAFGDEVRVAKFTGWETLEYDANDNAQAISVKFAYINTIMNNQPVIIKVPDAVEEFTVDGVNLEFDNEPMTAVGKLNQGTRGTFTGTYVPMVLDDPEDLFISNNKFYYSNGSSNMKGYRGYFWFQDMIVNPDDAHARLNFVVGDESEITGISSISHTMTDEVYNMQGVRVNNPRKGLYIKNGKKMVNK